MSITLEPYNPQWPTHFAQIQASLSAQLNHIDGVTIHHIGSTSVPSLCARPTIDILVTCPLAKVETIAAIFASSEACTGLIQERTCGTIISAHPGPDRYAQNMYICASGSPAERIHLAIRDVLHEDEELRDEYAGIKMRGQSAAYDAGDADRVSPYTTYTKAKRDAIYNLVVASARFTSEELAAILSSDCSARWTPLTTPRLLLREFEMGDVDGMFALEGSEENARYQDWPPWTRAQARQNTVRGIRGSYEKERNVVELGVEYGAAFVGRVGGRVSAVSEAARETGGGGVEEHEAKRPVKHVDLWFSVLLSCQGKGLATEAMTAFIAELVEREKVDDRPIELEIECDPRNTGSWKLAERLGFEKHSLTERAWESKGEWVDSLVYRRLV